MNKWDAMKAMLEGKEVRVNNSNSKCKIKDSKIVFGEAEVEIDWNYMPFDGYEIVKETPKLLKYAGKMGIKKKNPKCQRIIEAIDNDGYDYKVAKVSFTEEDLKEHWYIQGEDF